MFDEEFLSSVISSSIFLVSLSFASYVYLFQINQSAAYFLMPTRFWEMAAGCILFIIFQKRKSIEKLSEKVPPTLVLALIIGVMYLPLSLGTVSTFLVVLLSAVLLASLKKKNKDIRIFYQSQSGLYRSYFLFLVPMALGCSLS